MELPAYVNVPDFLKIGIMAMLFVWLVSKALEKFEVDI